MSRLLLRSSWSLQDCLDWLHPHVVLLHHNICYQFQLINRQNIDRLQVIENTGVIDGDGWSENNLNKQSQWCDNRRLIQTPDKCPITPPPPPFCVWKCRNLSRAPPWSFLIVQSISQHNRGHYNTTTPGHTLPLLYLDTYYIQISTYYSVTSFHTFVTGQKANGCIWLLYTQTPKFLWIHWLLYSRIIRLSDSILVFAWDAIESKNCK